MKKALGLFLVLVIGGFVVYQYAAAPDSEVVVPNENEKNAPSPLNATYIIENQAITLKDGKFVESDAVYTEIFGVSTKGDLNGDGIDDYALIIMQDFGGSGTFSYAALAFVDAQNNIKGTNVVFLGDRIAPQTVEIKDGRAVFNFADRKPNEPMSAQPSIGKSVWIQYDKVTGEISEANILSQAQARVIAEKICIKGAETLGAGTYNEITKTWWYDANLNATKEGCNPACVVSEETKEAEINWRCTGLITKPDLFQIADECVARQGKWSSQYNECEISVKKWCEEKGGVFNECASACRHDPNAQACILLCVPVCQF